MNVVSELWTLLVSLIVGQLVDTLILAYKSVQLEGSLFPAVSYVASLFFVRRGLVLSLVI